MADRKDIDAIMARSNARIKAALRNQIIWIGAIAALFVGAVAALLRLS